MAMVSGMRATGAGVVVLSCADPRIFPEKILGLDATLSMNLLLIQTPLSLKLGTVFDGEQHLIHRQRHAD